MALQDHIVPQEVTKYEFKIFAGLTWRQFIIVGGGAAVAYLIYYMGRQEIISMPVALILAFFSFITPIAATFIRIEDIPIILLATKFLRYFKTPPLMVWRLPKGKPVTYKNRMQSKPHTFPGYFIYYFQKGALSSQQAGAQTAAQFINIDSTYIQKFTNPNVKVPNRPNTIPLQLVTPDGKPISKAEVMLLNREYKPLFKGVSNQAGVVYFNSPLPNGDYFITVKHPDAVFPTFKISLSGKPLPLIKISPRQ